MHVQGRRRGQTMGKNGDVEVEVKSRHRTGYVSLWRDGGGALPRARCWVALAST